MPKNSSVTILKRWRAMDMTLNYRGAGGLNLAAFAKHHKVTVKTVRRDLEAFKALGQDMVQTDPIDGVRYWQYALGTNPLFLSTWRFTK
jgi:hypothetical protein